MVVLEHYTPEQNSNFNRQCYLWNYQLITYGEQCSEKVSWKDKA